MSDNEQSLNKILDAIRMGSIVILLLHFYFYNYAAFETWGVTSKFGHDLIGHIADSGLFRHFYTAKLLALLCLGVSLIGANGKKKPELSLRTGLEYIGIGIVAYFGSYFVVFLDAPLTHIAVLYIVVTSIGYLLILTGGNYLSRTLFGKGPADVFNRLAETFPQEERIVENEYSIQFPAQYELKGGKRKSWINIPNPFRGIFLAGNPGSMKTAGFVEPAIKQMLAKKYTMLVFDYKYDDLSKVAYNYYLRYKHLHPAGLSYFNIHFGDLDRCNRCNCLAPYTMDDIADAAESSRSILFGLNKEWVSKEGEFFVESAVNFITGIIWFLRKYNNGKYCTWPHVIELAGASFRDLFTVLRAEPEIEAYVNPFIQAFEYGMFDQLGGQVASAKIGLARLSSPSLYYVLTGNDFTLDLNNPKAPKILTLGSDPKNANIYGAFLSVFVNTINRMVNKKGMSPFAEILDECSSITLTSLDKILANGRSNRIAILMAIQNINQLRLTYGRAYADVLFNVCGNIISGQVTGDTAKQISEIFGKSMQEQESTSYSNNNTTVSKSKRLEPFMPVSRIATLSSGEFVGIVADNPDQRIELKAFCSRLTIDLDALTKERVNYKELPVVRKVTRQMVHENYLQVKKDAAFIIQTEMDRIANSPELAHMIIEENKRQSPAKSRGRRKKSL